MTTPKEIVEFAKQNDVEMVDLKFIDFLGTWQHFTVPVSELNEEMLDEGRMFDGSSIRCWQTIDNSDMKVMPDLDTVKMDAFYEVATMSIICDIKDPVTGEGYTRDPRSVTKKAENYLISTGIGDTIFVGPEAEFFMFDDVRYAQGPEGGFYSIDSPECPWNTGVEEVGGNKAYKIGHKSGYFPAAPFDQDRDIRAEMVLAMQELGLTIEAQHHEVAPAQHEIDFKFDTMLKTADMLQHLKYVVRNVAQEYGKTATFMPKPMFADNGSGMHTNFSFYKMRDTGSEELMNSMCDALGAVHSEGIKEYGSDNDQRLTGLHETQSIDQFSYGVSDRGASIRIPIYTVQNNWNGYLEDRRPASNADPYRIINHIVSTLDKD